MKFGVQSSIGASFAQENFQQGRKGQKPKGRKVKRPKFQKLFTNNMSQTQSPPHGFTSIFKLKGPISWDFALELIVDTLFFILFSVSSHRVELVNDHTH